MFSLRNVSLMIYFGITGFSRSEGINQSIESRSIPVMRLEAAMPISLGDSLAIQEQIIRIRKLEYLPEPFRRFPNFDLRCGEGIKSDPADLIISGGRGTDKRRRIFALIPCRRGTTLSHSLFYLDIGSNEVNMINVPTLNYNGSIVSTVHPGHMEWHSDTYTLTSTLVTDFIPTYIFRMHYKFIEPNRGAVALFRVERNLMTSGLIDELKWTTVWEAPQWGEVGFIRAPE